MAKADTNDRNSRKRGARPSLDQALLDEFFSIIASIVLRLTKVNACGKNGGDSDKREVIKP